MSEGSRPLELHILRGFSLRCCWSSASFLHVAQVWTFSVASDMMFPGFAP